MTDEFRAALEKRFWTKVNITDGCWEWTASTHHGSPNMAHKGHFPYGRIGVAGRIERAHRVSFELAYGPIPPGLFVLHSCDNPKCVRPDHLKLGTHKDNMQDIVDRQRAQRGEEHTHAKLTEQQVLEIRKLVANGAPYAQISKQFSICFGNIHKIKYRITWNHLPVQTHQ